MDILLGVMFAVLGSIFYGVSVVPRKLSKQKVSTFVMFDGLGFFIASVVFFGIIKLCGNTENLFDIHLILWGALCGTIWMAGSTFFFMALDRIGLSKSSQWKNLQGPIGAFLIFFILSEASSVNIWFLLASITAIFISALLFSIKGKNEKKFNIWGIVFATTAAILYGCVALIQKYLSMEGFVFAQQIWFSLFVFLSAFIFMLIKEKNVKCFKEPFKKDNAMGLLGGGLYFLGSLFVALAYSYMSGSVAFTIVQLNAFWIILIGIIFFKEIDFKQHWKRIVLGFLFVALGIGMLSFA